MEKNKTIFNYLTNVFALYGVIVSIYVLLSIIIGDYIGGYSSLFRLGSKGLSIPTLLQLLLLAVIINIAQNIFLTNKLIKNMPILSRNLLFFITIMILAALLIILFDWFPVNNFKAWIGFCVSYTISVSISVVITWLKERAENNKLQEALDKYNKQNFTS